MCLGLGHKCFKNSDCDKATKNSKCGHMNDQKNTIIVIKASTRKHDKNKLSNKSKQNHRNLFHSSNHQITMTSSSKLTNSARTGYRTVSRQSKLTKKFQKDTFSNHCRCLGGYEENDEKTNCTAKKIVS